MSITIPTPLLGGLELIEAASTAIADAPMAEDVMAEQVAALCWRLHKGRTQVLMVTSRDTGRWVLPKGWPMAGKPSEVAAAREAWEEAGVEGLVKTQKWFSAAEAATLVAEADLATLLAHLHEAPDLLMAAT
jgi:8-oxo-dGTP pyrophosphatase MutT (NUDIX family)